MELFMKLRFSAITDRGLNPNRVHNEDSFSANEPLFIVADGLGGELAGEVASQMTVEKFKTFFDDATRDDGRTPPSELKVIERVIQRVNYHVYQEAQKPEYRNMGSTLSVLYFCDGRALIGHVGDSKIFRVRNGQVDQLTRDQSIVQQMVDRGVITAEQARRHPMRNVLLSCIAHKPDIEVYISNETLEENDFYLLCSDGVSEYLTADMLIGVLSEEKTPEGVCERIKGISYAGGAMDNLTAIAVFVDSLTA
jgi:protein phosphatase